LTFIEVEKEEDGESSIREPSKIEALLIRISISKALEWIEGMRGERGGQD
jgi:hypothetical protein